MSLNLKKKNQSNIYFLNKIFKNGYKYRFLKFLKNSIFFFKIFKGIQVNKIRTIFCYYDIFKKIDLNWMAPKYFTRVYTKKTKKKTSKYLKSIPILKDKRIQEFFKILNLLLYKLPIRTIQLRIFYLIFTFYTYSVSFFKLTTTFDEDSVNIKKKIIKVNVKKKIFLNEKKRVKQLKGKNPKFKILKNKYKKILKIKLGSNKTSKLMDDFKNKFKDKFKYKINSL